VGTDDEVEYAAADWADWLKAPLLTQLPPSGPGPVEAAIGQEVDGLAMAVARPALVETAKVLGRILDNPRAVSQQAAAAGKLADITARLHKGAAARRGGLALVRTMVEERR